MVYSHAILLPALLALWGGKGTESLLGSTAPKAASVLGNTLTKATEGFASGFGVGTTKGTLNSIIDGNTPLEVIKDAYKTGFEFGTQNMIASGLSGMYQSVKGFGPYAAKNSDVSVGKGSEINEFKYKPSSGATLKAKGSIFWTTQKS